MNEDKKVYTPPPHQAQMVGSTVRELAVEIVDGVSGYTIENSPYRETHAHHYDQVEERLTAFFGTPSEQFAKWLELGPRLAKAAGCYVGIKVSAALSAPEAEG